MLGGGEEVREEGSTRRGEEAGEEGGARRWGGGRGGGQWGGDKVGSGMGEEIRRGGREIRLSQAEPDLRL